ncbi:L-arabinose transport system permease protein AraQ [compost metagenome]|uniref:Carbohydrate ABC transporter permease n=1 Tax=Paenibacillus rhizolycopersici TaxID=2780073 RepID=A0ABS2H2H2_9BACL|nr:MULTISPECIES: carbohydrate ABC transporter permease [Paenibacillus]MBM6995642.1 carbohydrate ABC transporter permease [Paenibacillus rhizolycopersici]MUG85768.1 ABC transporter permease subunit [Paenibacillus timonensis]
MRMLKKSIPHLFLMAYLLIILYPFLFVLFSSVKTDNQAIASNPFGLPSSIIFDNYVNAWVNAKISTFFFNSLYIGVLSACLSIFFAAMLAFAVTRMRYNRISAIVFQLILLGMLIPNNSLLLPIYGMMRNLNVLDTHMALILPYVANAIPFSVIILAAFMRSIPGEIEEAAVMDGLSSLGMFFKVMLPLTVPAIVTVFIINFLGNWNEFLLANYFLSSEELRTLPVGMVGFRDAYNTNYAQMSAGIVFSVLPVMIIYAVLQEKIIEGVTAGSVKG